MANPEHLEILRKGIRTWNEWRDEVIDSNIKPDLTNAKLDGCDLSLVNFSEVNLKGASLKSVNLSNADLSKAFLDRVNLEMSILNGSRIRHSSLYHAILRKAFLIDVDLRESIMYGVNLEEANMVRSNLSGCRLGNANMQKVNLSDSELVDAYLESVNLEAGVLLGSDLSRCSFDSSSMKRVDMSHSKICKASLRLVDLEDAILLNANLSDADLSESNLRSAILTDAVLVGANLSGADLTEAYLNKANLEGGVFTSAVLIKTDLRNSNLVDTVFFLSSLIDSLLDGANLNGAKLWETQRSSWSIKGVVCEYAYFDRNGKKKEVYKDGEFERLYSEKTKIILHYEDVIHPVEVVSIPALIQFIENKYDGSKLHLRAIYEDAGGRSAEIVVDELGDNDVNGIRNEMRDLVYMLRTDVRGLSEKYLSPIVGELQALSKEIKDKPMDRTYNNYGIHNGPVGDGVSMGGVTININDLEVISKLIPDIMTARQEIARVMPPEKWDEFENAIEVIQEELAAQQKEPSKFKNAWTTAKAIITEAVDIGANLATIVTSLNGVKLPFV